MRRRRAAAGPLALLAGALVLVPTPGLQAEDAGGVRAWAEPITLPTYEVGPPEPSPMFFAGRAYQGAKGPVYPYPLQDRFGSEKRDRQWQALWLENEYLTLAVLPELGGRIFIARDRTNGYDFFYRQHVVKPALIGMLGAWISGGVEWNVLHHHRATSFMPVQAAIAANPDGSRTLWIGETEWRHRMRWVIGLTLQPGSSVIEQTLRVFNRTPLPHSVLYFANPAVHANESYQVLFPPDVQWATFHAKSDFSRWPLSDGPFRGVDYAPGTDLSWWKSHPEPISFFVYDSDLDFFGGYDHAREAGVVHVADHEVVPGKKLWEWGNGPDGRAWDAILTDADGPYIELMAGGFSDNQPDYAWIEPGQSRRLQQHWYPIRELGGLKAATTRAAVDLAVDGESVRIAVNTTSAHDAARVRLTAGEAVLLDEAAALSPARPFSRRLALPAGTARDDLELAVLASDGSELVAYRPAPLPDAPEPVPYQPPPEPEAIASVEELVLAGQRLEQFHSPHREPKPYYREALQRDPGSSRAHAALGALALRRGEYEEAERHLTAAVRRVTTNHTRARDTEPLYLHGLALDALGRTAEAREAFAAAAWDRAWTAPASLAQARLESRGGDRERARVLLGRAIAADPSSTAALALRAALLRDAGRVQAAFDQATAALSLDPLDPLAARERSLSRRAGAAADPDAALDSAETAALAWLDDDRYALEAAHDYAAAGLLDDAVAVLADRLPRADSAADPVVAYTLGWLHARRGEPDASAAAYRRGKALSPEYCFPFRLESLAILESAAEADPGDARAPYYLGNLLYDLQPERAIREWERAQSLDPAFARVHRNLAFAYARVRGDLAAAVASQERAVRLEKGEPRLYYELDRLLDWSDAPWEERLAWLGDSPGTVASRDITRARLARVQLLGGRADDALETLGGGHYRVWEGERGVHGILLQARLEKGRGLLAAGDAAGALREYRAAIAIPANIEVGRDAEAHLAAVRYHEALALEALGRSDEARISLEAVAEARPAWATDHYWIGRSLQALGRAEAARAHFERLAGTEPPPVEASASTPLERRMAAVGSRADAFFLRGLGLLGLGRDAQARRALADCREVDPDHLEAVVFERSPFAPPADGRR